MLLWYEVAVSYLILHGGLENSFAMSIYATTNLRFIIESCLIYTFPTAKPSNI